MLDSHVDGLNVDGRSEAPSGGGDFMASHSGDSFEVNCKLPDLPLKTIISQIDIIGKLRQQGEVRNLLGFQPSSHLARVPEISEDDISSVPYIIPEVEKSGVSAEAGQMNESTLGALEDPNASGIPDVIEPNLSRIEEISVPRTQEQSVLVVAEPQVPEIHSQEFKEENMTAFEDINVTNIGEPDALEMTGPSGAENVSEQIVIKPANQEPSSGIIIAQQPIQIEELIPKAVEKPMLGRSPGIISSMIGRKPIWKPSVRLCFGDREQRRTYALAEEEEEIKQQTSIALKSLILSISLFKKFDPSFQEKFNEHNLNLMDRSSCLTFSRVFRQNVFQPPAVPENQINQERLPENPEIAMAGGEPAEQNLILQNQEILYNLGVRYGCLRNPLDSDASESSDSDDSGVSNTMCMRGLSGQMLKVKRPIPDRQDIEKSGKILFTQPVRLFRFNTAEKWQREGLESPYTGDIQIVESNSKYYILLREKNTGFLLVYTRVDGSWHIGYMANRTNSCGWFNFNYAFCPEGTPEHFACTFREPSHAAEFVASIRSLVIKCRSLVSSP